jgi:hypothetical protein
MNHYQKQVPRVFLPFVLLFSLVLAGCEAGEPDGSKHASLYTIYADGGGQALLRSDPELASWGAAWSPDGARLVFTVFEPGEDQGERCAEPGQ